MRENKLIKFLIPLVAAVVIFESVVLVTSLDKGVKQTGDSKTATESANVTESVVSEEPVLNFVFATDTTEMKIGKTYKVTLNLLPKQSKKIDGVEAYIKYDSVGLKVTNLSSNNKLQKPTISKIDSQLGLIKNVVLIDDKSGFSLVEGELVSVLTFNVTPQKEGTYNFELNTGNTDKNIATIVVENSSAKPLVWSGDKLEVNVIK